MPKYKVGDKVRVVRTHNTNSNLNIGDIYEISRTDFGWEYPYLLKVKDHNSVWASEDDLEPVSKRGRPRKGEERHKTGSCREELNELKKEFEKYISEFKEFKQTTETNITKLGYEVNKIAVSKPEEKKVELTEAERVILRNVDYKFKWVSRDKDGGLFIFEEKPIQDKTGWTNRIMTNYKFLTKSCALFQFIRWEDNEPYEIAKLLEGV